MVKEKLSKEEKQNKIIENLSKQLLVCGSDFKNIMRFTDEGKPSLVGGICGERGVKINNLFFDICSVDSKFGLKLTKWNQELTQAQKKLKEDHVKDIGKKEELNYLG